MAAPKKPTTTRPRAAPAKTRIAGTVVYPIDDIPVDEPAEDDDDAPNDGMDTAPTGQAEPGQAKAKTGPVKFSMLIADYICQQIAIGQPLQEICKSPEMPTVTQVQAWVRKYAKFTEMYEQARSLQADYLADEMLMLVKEMRSTTQPGRASALRAAADLLAKQAEWRAPRKYGPKMDITMTDRPKTPDEIKAEILRLRAALGVPEGRIARIK